MLGKLFGFGRKSGGERSGDRALGVDREMNYCPRCGDEYRADIVRCVGCDVDLISGSEKYRQASQEARERGSRTMDISADDELVAIKSGKLKDLKPIQVLLARETIPALLTGEGGGCSSG
jgi:hypothetical protein